MFDTNQTNEYRQTTVPVDWEKDILFAADNAQKRSKRPFTRIISLAACLTLLVCGVFIVNAFTVPPAVTTTVTQPSPVAVARDISPCAYITLTANGTIRVLTDSDSLLWVDEHGNTSPFTDKEATDTVTLEWTVSTETAVFTANGQQYTVTYDTENGKATVTPTVSD